MKSNRDPSGPDAAETPCVALESRAEAAKQVVEQGQSVRDVATRLGAASPRCMHGHARSARRQRHGSGSEPSGGGAAATNRAATRHGGALLAAVWRRKPAPRLTLHSDQGSQFTGGEWQAFSRAQEKFQSRVVTAAALHTPLDHGRIIGSGSRCPKALTPVHRLGAQLTLGDGLRYRVKKDAPEHDHPKNFLMQS